VNRVAAATTTAPGRLRPVEVALADDANASGSAVLAEASHEAARILEAAQAQAERTVDEAREEGAAVGARLVSATRAGARREAREIILGAWDDAYQLLRRSVLEELARRKDSQEVRDLNSRLAHEAIELLGSRATLVWDPIGVGLFADAGTRRIDSSAERLVDDCLAELGQAMERLWS